jgi:hypothetical protein
LAALLMIAASLRDAEAPPRMHAAEIRQEAGTCNSREPGLTKLVLWPTHTFQ